MFSANITSIVQRVSYPALSEIQDSKDRLINAYRKVIKTTMFVVCVCIISLGAASEPLIYCLIGPQWHEAATYLPLICISMSLYPLHAINLNMLQIQGRSDIFLYLEITKKIIGIVPLLIGAFYNIYGMLIGSIVTGVLSLYIVDANQGCVNQLWHSFFDSNPYLSFKIPPFKLLGNPSSANNCRIFLVFNRVRKDPFGGVYRD